MIRGVESLTEAIQADNLYNNMMEEKITDPLSYPDKMEKVTMCFHQYIQQPDKEE